MKRMVKDKKGAVTVIVSLLLIPALLISGTAVDLARAITAKSILEDANMLAMNAALTQYNAELQDLYGLFGVVDDDPILEEMLDDYINITIFGIDPTDGEGKSMPLFNGNITTTQGTDMLIDGQNLANPDVLRRQIEEYSKFRAPAILVETLLDKIDSFEKLAEDQKLIKSKMNVDKDLEKLFDAYKKIYDKLQLINNYKASQYAAYEDINSTYIDINNNLILLHDYVQAFVDDKSVVDEDGELIPKKVKEYQDKIDDCYDDIDSLTDELNGKIKKYKKEFDSLHRELFSTGFNSSLMELAETANKKRNDLKSSYQEMVDAKPGASDELQQGLDSKNANGKSLMEEYENLAEFDVVSLVKPYVDYLKPIMYDEKLFYTELQLLPSDDLNTFGADFSYDGIAYNWVLNNKIDLMYSYYDVYLYRGGSSDDLHRRSIRATSGLNFSAPDYLTEFNKSKGNYNPTSEAIEFYAELEKMFSSGGDKKYDEMKKVSNKMVSDPEGTNESGKNSKNLAENYIANGAQYFDMSIFDKNNMDNEGGSEIKSKWDDTDAAQDDMMKQMDDGGFVGQLANFGDEVVDKGLLTVYGMEMFSNYTTRNEGEESMAKIPFGTEVNYFFQSELEYMIVGKDTAVQNIGGVSGMIFLIRFILNYISTFIVNEVKTDLNVIGNIPEVGFILREIARLGYAVAESVYDVATLMERPSSENEELEGVPIFKTSDDQWWFSASGAIQAAAMEVVEEFSEDVTNKAGADGVDSGVDADPKKALELNYRHYLMIFLMLKNGDTTAQRISNLISLNVNQYKNKIDEKTWDDVDWSKALPDEYKDNVPKDMQKALEKQATSEIKSLGTDIGKNDILMWQLSQSDEFFKLGNTYTDFQLSTTAEIKMIFMSMPVFQQGINGTIPPGTMPVNVTTYGGY